MSLSEEDDEEIVINFDDDDDINNQISVNISYDLNQEPIMIKNVFKEYEDEEGNQNYLKGCKWSPDGTCLLTNSEDHCLRLYNLPNELYQSPFVFNNNLEMAADLKMKENDLVYDYAWYPSMNSLEPSSCFFITTSCRSPIHLWNAYTGQIDAMYVPYNHLEEVVSSYSLAFNPDGSKIYAGFTKCIRVFDTAIPGRSFETRPTYVEKSGQHGIISCITINSRKTSIYAAGSYSKQIGLYEEPSGNVICILMGQKGGVTHLAFSSDGTRLYSGARKDAEINCWDLRKLGTILFSLKREVTTNQRIYFDLSSNSDLLISGSDNGQVYIWNLSQISQVANDQDLNPIKTWQANYDSVNGVSLHPTLPLIATSSGQRKFATQTESDDEEYMFTRKTIKSENSLRLWWLSKLDKSIPDQKES